MILSKLPGETQRFSTNLKRPQEAERLVFNKGVLGVALSDPDEGTRPCACLNAHLQSDFWRESRETREEQAKEMKTFVQKSIHSRVFVGSSSSDVIDAAVVCGDLNCIAGSAEYEKIMEVLGGEKQTFRDTLPIGDDDDESLQDVSRVHVFSKKREIRRRG